MSEDFSVPRNLTNTLFQDLELPQHSKIEIKTNSRPIEENNRAAITESKYRQSDENDFPFQLSQQSSIQKNTVQSNKDSTDTEENSPISKIVPKSKMANKKKKKRPEPQQKKEIDIDNYIGEVAEWAEKGARNNEEEEDFNEEAENVGQTAQQLEIRRKLEEKLKNGFGQKPKTGGLQAKAQQLKKANVAKSSAEKEASSTEDLVDKKPKKEVEASVPNSHETSAAALAPNRPQHEESEDDPWQKVNEKTIKHYQKRKDRQKEMSIEMVVKFYKEQFEFEDEGIQVEEELEEKEQQGWLEMLCACFKSGEKSKKQKNNTSIAKRLVAISKKQLTNTDQQFFILQQIWNRLTSQPFSRYGTHWNQIGFQGRDPATDLRSTGVLSILQWILFLQNHPKEAQDFATWSMENEYPLALTHIKITGVFLDLLLRGKIIGQKWQDFQSSYNALMLGMLKKMKSQFKGGDTLGTLVQEEARVIKKGYKKQLQSYLSQYKK